MMGMSRETLKL